MWNNLRRFGVREADLEDVAQEVFLTFLRRIDDFDPSRPARPWLIGIAHRVASDYRRSAHVRRVVPLDPVREGNLASADEAASREGRDLVVRALREIDPDRAVVLVMHDVEGFGMAEVAEILGIPTNTGYSRLRIARGELAEAVRRLGGGTP